MTRRQDSENGWNRTNKSLPCKEEINPTKLLSLRTANRQTVYTVSVGDEFVCFSGLRLRTIPWIVENFALDGLVGRHFSIVVYAG